MTIKIGYRYVFAGVVYEVVRSGSQDEIGLAALELNVPDHWVVRDENGNELLVSTWFVSELGTEVTSL